MCEYVVPFSHGVIADDNTTPSHRPGPAAAQATTTALVLTGLVWCLLQWLCRRSGKLAKSCKHVTFSTQISRTTMRKTSKHMFTHIFRLSNSMSQVVDAAQVRINLRVSKIYQYVALVESLIYKRWRCSIAACSISVRQELKNPGNPDHP